MPVFLFIWHKFIQPLVDRLYGKPKLESGKADGKLNSDEKELQDVPNGDLKAESDVLPAKEVAVDGHAKSE